MRYDHGKGTCNGWDRTNVFDALKQCSEVSLWGLATHWPNIKLENCLLKEVDIECPMIEKEDFPIGPNPQCAYVFVHTNEMAACVWNERIFAFNTKQEMMDFLLKEDISKIVTFGSAFRGKEYEGIKSVDVLDMWPKWHTDVGCANEYGLRLCCAFHLELSILRDDTQPIEFVAQRAFAVYLMYDYFQHASWLHLAKIAKKRRIFF